MASRSCGTQTRPDGQIESALCQEQPFSRMAANDRNWPRVDGLLLGKQSAEADIHLYVSVVSV